MGPGVICEMATISEPMMTLHRLVLDQRQHTIAATESEESDLKERDEQTEKYHLLTLP